MEQVRSHVCLRNSEKASQRDARIFAGELDIVVGAQLTEIVQKEGITCEPLFKINFSAASGSRADIPPGKQLSYSVVADFPIVLYQDDQRPISEVVKKIEDVTGKRLNICVKTMSLLSAIELVRNGPFLLLSVEPILQKLSEFGLRVLQFQNPLHDFQTAVYYRESLKQAEPFTQVLSMLRGVQSGRSLATQP
mgnify:CR=1 FL=1